MEKRSISPLVSICIPIYGVEKYIEKCARSVFEQTYENIEFIFVNDCTKDNSINVLRQVISDYPSLAGRIQIIEHAANKGLAGARNTAVENASGDFILWIDSDDYVSVTTVDKLINKQLEKNADIVISDVYRCYNGFREYVSLLADDNPRRYLHQVLRDETEHWLAGKLIRTKLYTDHKICALEGANMGEDFQVYPQLVYYSTKICFVEEALYNYMFYNTNSYGHTVSESVQNQRWLSYGVLENKFKGTEYETDLNYQKLQMCYFQIKTYITNTGLSTDYFKMLVTRLNEVPDEIYNQYPLFKRLLLNQYNHKNIDRLSENKTFFAVQYVRLINLLNYSIRYVKSKTSYK